MSRHPYKYHNPHSDDETGNQWEEEFLFPQRSVPKKNGLPPYKRLREAIIDCIQHPQYKPSEVSDPPARLISDIHCYLAEELGLRDFNHLQVYPSLFRSLDEHHGVDFFFLFRDPKTGHEVIVTVDLTVRPGKEKHKADLVIKPDLTVANDDYYDFRGGNRLTNPKQSFLIQ